MIVVVPPDGHFTVLEMCYALFFLSEELIRPSHFVYEIRKPNTLKLLSL